MLDRQGVSIDRSTLAFWVGYAAAEVAPVVARLREIVLASARIFADETVVPVLDPGRGRTKKGYFWAIARDRPWGGTDPPAVVYTDAPGRGQEHALALLRGYRGVLQCDGYAAYKQLGGGQDGATLVFCWSHVRRGFYDVAKGGAAPIATEALERIAALYRIEAGIRGKEAAHRLTIRQAESQLLVIGLRAWFELQMTRPAARGPTADAIRYALNHGAGLVRFLEDGRIDVDTNPVERAIRPVALSRKNALFAGSDEGGANLGGGGVADRGLQAQPRQSAELSHRSPGIGARRPQPNRHAPRVAKHRLRTKAGAGAQSSVVATTVRASRAL